MQGLNPLLDQDVEKLRVALGLYKSRNTARKRLDRLVEDGWVVKQNDYYWPSTPERQRAQAIADQFECAGGTKRCT